jgi:O-antigen/teichoic acid export membrane protein
LLARELDYRRKLLPDLLPGMVNGAVSIFGAAHGWGVWSLVAGAQIGALVGVASVWQACRWRPGWIWDRRLAASLMRYGRHIVGAELLRFVTLNVDYLLVGRLFGPAALGVYTLAFNLANLVVTNAGFLFARVAFPLFSRLQDEPSQLQEAYLRMVSYLALIALPVLCGLCLLADDFVAVVYGPRWASAVAPLRVLTVLGAARALATLGGDVVRAVGRPDVLSRLGLLTAPLTAAGVFLGASFGLAGVAAGESLVTLLTATLLIRAALHLLRLEPSRLWRRVAPIVGATAVMALAVLLVAHGSHLAGLSHAARLSAATIAGAGLFCVALGRERATFLAEARRLAASIGWTKTKGAGHAS